MLYILTYGILYICCINAHSDQCNSLLSCEKFRQLATMTLTVKTFVAVVFYSVISSYKRLYLGLMDLQCTGS